MTLDELARLEFMEDDGHFVLARAELASGERVDGLSATWAIDGVPLDGSGYVFHQSSCLECEEHVVRASVGDQLTIERAMRVDVNAASAYESGSMASDSGDSE